MNKDIKILMVHRISRNIEAMISRARKNSLMWIMFSILLGIHVVQMAKYPSDISLMDGILAIAGLAVAFMHFLPDKG